MILFKDRVVQYPNRYSVTEVDGVTNIRDIISTPGTVTEEGTPLNAQMFNMLQGFDSKTTVFNTNGSIIETDSTTGAVMTTTFQSDGSIKEVLTQDGKSIIKTTSFNSDGSISEVIS